jgi:hypothetical protein
MEKDTRSSKPQKSGISSASGWYFYVWFLKICSVASICGDIESSGLTTVFSDKLSIIID